MTSANRETSRKSKRGLSYPVRAEVEYRLKQGRRVVEVGQTQSVSLSSSEIVINCARRLAPAMEIELALTWPGPLGASASTILRIKGRTSNGSGKRTRIQIGRYAFETRSSAKLPQAVATVTLPRVTPFAS
jgi:hypothetical protein